MILFNSKGREIDRIPDGKILHVKPLSEDVLGVYLITLDARYLPPGVCSSDFRRPHTTARNVSEINGERIDCCYDSEMVEIKLRGGENI